MKKIFFAFILLLVSLTSYGQAPKVTNIDPLSAIPGMEVTLYGINFNATPGNNTVTFDGIIATVSAATTKRLKVAVPVAGKGPVEVVVTTAGGSSNSFDFTILSDEAPGIFAEQRLMPETLSKPHDVYGADLDEDGDMDALCTSYTSGKVTWYQNDGKGNFTKPASSDIGSGSYAASGMAADLDGDGDMDVLAAFYNADRVSWYQNNGSGVFSAPASSNITTDFNGANDAFAADLDGDGDLDVLTSASVADTIKWLRNNGSGIFTKPASSFIAKWDNPSSVYAADLDGDADLDVIATSYGDHKIAWYQNNGSGDFSATGSSIIASTTQPRCVYAADLDGDGDMDILAGSYTDKIAWYKNNGSGTFTFEATISNYVAARSVYAADMDGDGDLDVLSANGGGNNVTWFENDGTGVFSDPASSTISSLTDNAYSAYPADLDNDGKLDVLSASSDDNKFAWYKNHFARITRIEPVAAIPGEKIEVFGNNIEMTGTSVTFNGTEGPVDWGNSDSLVLEVTVPDITPGLVDVKIIYTDGYSESQAPSNFTILSTEAKDTIVLSQVITTAADGASGVYAADLDGDGDMDVLSASRNDNKIAWYENDGGGNITVPASSSITTTADGAMAVHAADLDGDSDLDVLSASYDDNKIAWYENDGNGLFTAPSSSVITTSADGAISVFAADLDLDGDLDVVSASFNDSKIAWYENDGDGNFTLPASSTITTSASGALQVYSTDLDGDGDMDVISTDYTGGNVKWYANDGSGAFAAPVTILAGGCISLCTSDLNKNTHPDVITSSNISGDIFWKQNSGGGTFVASDFWQIADNIYDVYSLYSIDMDGDGWNDLLSASQSADRVSWHKNEGYGVFGTSHVITTSADAVLAVHAADLDGDGDMDVLSASVDDDKIAWYENSWSETGITGFSFTEQTGPATIDAGNHTVDIEVIAGSNVASLTPTIVLSSKATVNPASGTPNDFSNPAVYQVTADDGVTTQNWTITVIAVPEPPVLSFDGAGQTTAEISWNKPAFSEQFELELSVASDFTDFITGYDPKTLTKSELTEAISGLTIGTTSYARIRAVNINGSESENSTILEILTRPDTPVLDPPADVQQTQFSISWSACTGATGYEVDVSTDNFVTLLPSYSALDVTGTSLDITELETGTRYQVRVRAGNPSGLSPDSAPADTLTIPANPVAIKSTSVAQTSFTANWNSVSGADYYFLEVSVKADLSSPLSGYDGTTAISSTDTSQTLTGLLPGIVYYYRVTASNTAGMSGVSNIISQITVPADPVAVNASNPGQTSFVANWSPVTGADNYYLEASLNSDLTSPLSGYDGTVAIASTNSNETVSGLSPGVVYYYRVSAENDGGQSAPSNIISQITIPADPVASEPLAAEITSSGFKAKWDSVPGATGYELEISLNNFETLVAGYNPFTLSGTEVTVTNLQAETEYKFRVRSENSAGASGNSNEVSVTTLKDVTAAALSLANLTFSTTQDDTTTQTLDISVTGGSPPYVTVFSHRQLLEANFTEQTLTATSQGEYSVDITPGMLDILGVEFEVEVTDAADDSDSKTGIIAHSFDETKSPAIPFEHFGGTDLTWNLFSIPYELNNKSVSTLFADYNPSRYEYDWKVMRYRNTSNDYVNFQTGQITLGEGYWFNAKEDITIKTGAGQATTTIPFVKRLDKGWSLIGNPYPVDISWNAVVTNNSSVTGVGSLQVFSGITQSTGNIIKPFSGGFVWADETVSVEIDPVASGTASRIAGTTGISDRMEGLGWVIPLELTNNGNSYNLGGFGMHPEGEILKDRFDEMALPRFFRYLQLYSTHNDYFYSRFSTDIVPENNSHTWTFNLESNVVAGLVNLQWDDAQMDPDDQFYLFDKANGMLVDMKETGTYGFDFSGSHVFEFYFVKGNGEPVLPESLVLGNAYPNPARGKITIPVSLPKITGPCDIDLSVYDLQGKKVKTLADGHYDPGFYHFEWDRVNDNSRAGPGLYIYRLDIKDFKFKPVQKKLIIQ